MKKYSWIVALLLALTLAFVGCPNGDDDDEEEVVPVVPDKPAEPIDVTIGSGNIGAPAIGGDAPTVTATEDGKGYIVVYNAGHGNSIASFQVDLKDAKVSDYEKVTFTFEGLGGDLGSSTGQYDKNTPKALVLLANKAQFAGRGGDDSGVVAYMVSPYVGGAASGGNILKSGVKIGEPGEDGKIAPIDLEIAIDRARPNSGLSGAVWFSIYMHANPIKEGTNEKTSFKISNINFVPIEGEPTDITVGIAEIPLAAPVTGATPVTTITTSQYTGTVAWAPAVAAGGTFAQEVEYTATITLTAVEGFTFTGVTEDFFTVASATATNAANTGVVTAVFPATEIQYVAPGADGEGFFYLNLNDYKTVGSSGVGEGATASGVLAADKLTLTFAKNDERVNIGLTEAQIETLAAAKTANASITITIAGNATPDTQFRYHIGDATLGGSWNATSGTGNGAFSSILTGTQTFTANDAIKHFILQQRAAADTTVVITSIKITIVSYVAVTGVEITGATAGTPKTASVEVGADITLGATVEPTGATNKNVTWSSSDATIASVAAGVVTGVKAGTATITATAADSKTDTVSVTVTAPANKIKIGGAVTLAKPVEGATAATTVSGTGYTGTVVWSPALTDSKFAATTAYTATITLILTDADSYTLEEDADDPFTHATAEDVTYDDAGELVIEFEATGAAGTGGGPAFPDGIEGANGPTFTDSTGQEWLVMATNNLDYDGDGGQQYASEIRSKFADIDAGYASAANVKLVVVARYLTQDELNGEGWTQTNDTGAMQMTVKPRSGQFSGQGNGIDYPQWDTTNSGTEKELEYAMPQFILGEWDGFIIAHNNYQWNSNGNERAGIFLVRVKSIEFLAE